MEAAELLDELVRAFSEGKAAGEVGDERQFLIVARGHESLLEQIRGVVGEMGWFRVIENRRRDGTLLPRAGAEGTFFSP